MREKKGGRKKEREAGRGEEEATVREGGWRKRERKTKIIKNSSL